MSTIVGGADIEARGGSIAGGTALENAIGYGCWPGYAKETPMEISQQVVGLDTGREVLVNWLRDESARSGATASKSME